MKEQYLAEALQEVSDEHIMEATLPLRKKKRKRPLRGLAACFAVLVVCSGFAAYYFGMGGGSAAESESMQAPEENGAATGSYGATEDSLTYPVEGDSPDFTNDGAGSCTMVDELGIMLTTTDITSTGLTLVCAPMEDLIMGEIITGSWYAVERYEGGTWTELPYLLDNVGWTEEGWIIPADAAVEWSINWEWLYGELPAGEYRIGKEFILSRSPGDYDSHILYGYFTIN